MITGSIQYLRFQGAEMLIEIARLWASIATYNRQLDRYEILGVMGPDEYHDAYPGSDTPGVNNNAYTNLMAVWVLLRALQALDQLPPHYRHEVMGELGLSADELDRWRDITKKMRVIFTPDGMLAQFEGYDQLEEFDFAGYRARYGNIRRLDRVLEAEGDGTNRYQISKQADVLMLRYLLPSDELQDLLSGLGYHVTAEQLAQTVDYYLARTVDGSTLSGVVTSWVLARQNPAEAWRCLLAALNSDVADIQGNDCRGHTPGRNGRHHRHRAALPDRNAGARRHAEIRSRAPGGGQAAPVQRPLPGQPARHHPCLRLHVGHLPAGPRGARHGHGQGGNAAAGARRARGVPVLARAAGLLDQHVDGVARTTSALTVADRYCEGSGICVAECPYGAIEMVPERT